MTQNCTDMRKWLNVITALTLFSSVYTHISWGLICIFIKKDTPANRKWWSVVRVEHSAFTLLSAHLCFPPKSPWAIFNQAKVKYLKKTWLGLGLLGKNVNINQHRICRLTLFQINPLSSIATELSLFVADPQITLSVPVECSHHHINSSWPPFSAAQSRKQLFASEQIDSLAVRESFTKQAPFINPFWKCCPHNTRSLLEENFIFSDTNSEGWCTAALLKSRTSM